MTQGLNYWLNLLAPKSLPILPLTRAELGDLMANPNLSVMQYAGPILQDPGFSIQLLKKANSDRAAGGRPALTTMVNVLSHLGQGKLKQQLDTTKSLTDLDIAEKNQQGYLRYVAQAWHCAYQARDWAQTRGTHQPEEMQLAALQQNVAELALWCFADDVMPRIEEKVHVKKQDYDEATKSVLGCHIRELSAALAEKWYLTELGIESLKSAYAGFTLATGVAFASRLARCADNNWYNQITRTCIDDIAAYKNKSVGEVESRIHQNALALTDDFIHAGYRPPAFYLPMLADDSYVDLRFVLEPEKPDLKQKIDSDKEVIKEKPTPTKPTVAKDNAVSKQKTIPKQEPAEAAKKTVSVSITQQVPAQQSVNDLAAEVKKIQQMIVEKVAVQDLIQQVVDTLALLGFERVMFAMKAPKLKLLVGQYYACKDNVKALQGIKITVDKPHVFSLLLEKPQHIWIHDKNRSKYWNLIPSDVKLMLDNNQFFAMSVFAGKRPIGLLYVDSPKGELTDDQYKKFQGLCRMLSKGVVEILASRKKAGG